MTNEQFNLLMAAQLAQINLLKSIQETVCMTALKEDAGCVTQPNWKTAQQELDDALSQWTALSKAKSDANAKGWIDYISEEAGGKA